VNFPGAIFHQKSATTSSAEQRWTPAPRSEIAGVIAPAIKTHSPSTPAVLLAEARPLAPANRPAAAESEATAAAAAELLYQQGRYAEAADTMVASLTRRAPDREAFSLLARALANQGKLADALTWCERWIDADKIDPAGHYLRAVVLLEQGDPQQARVCLHGRSTLILTLCWPISPWATSRASRGKSGESNKHFDNTLQLLRAYRPDDLLPESDGLTAGRLTETLTAITGSSMSP